MVMGYGQIMGYDYLLVQNRHGKRKKLWLIGSYSL